MPLDYIQNCTGCSHCHWVTAKSAEKLHVFFSKTFGYLFGTDESSYRTAITHSLSYSKNIWYNIIIFVGPEVLANSSKTSLHFITNTDNSFCSQMLIQSFIELFWGNYLASTALHKFTDKSWSIFFDEILKVIWIIFNRILRIFKFSSVKAWNASNGNMISFFVMLAPFIWTYLHRFSSNSVVSSVKTNDAFFISMKFRHLHCQVICLRSRVNKRYHT